MMDSMAATCEDRPSSFLMAGAILSAASRVLGSSANWRSAASLRSFSSWIRAVKPGPTPSLPILLVQRN
jgi:hypothetical protein